jgi:hypothetical protein
VTCGKRWCTDSASAQAFARKIAQRIPAASEQGHRLRELVTSADLSGTSEFPLPVPTAYPWDRVEASAKLNSPLYEATLAVRLHPVEGAAAAMARWASQASGVKAETSFGTGTQLAAGDDFYEVVFARSDAVIRMRCGKGLCGDEDSARKLARRAYDNAENAANFIDENAMVPRPFVPRGNIKGRAEVIWLPIGRFGTPIP